MNIAKYMTARRYTEWDYVRIIFMSAPLLTSVIVLQSAVSALLPSVNIFITASFVDTAVSIFDGTKQTSSIILPLLLLFVTAVYSRTVGSLIALVSARHAQKVTQALYGVFLTKRARLEFRHVENNDTWELISRASSNPDSRLRGGFMNILSATALIINIFSVLTVLSTQLWWAGLITVALAVPMVLLGLKNGKRSYDAFTEANKYARRSDMFGGLLISRACVEERTVFSYSERLNGEWYGLYEKSRRIKLKADIKNHVNTRISSVSAILISGVASLALIYPLNNGSVSVGMFIALVTATFNLVQMMSWQFSEIVRSFADNHEYLKDLSAFMQLSETADAEALPVKYSENNGKINSIEFRNVSFSYPGTQKAILKDFSAVLYGDMHYAIVGVNGAGKTTLTKLLIGLYDGYDGEILINGRNLRTYSQGELKGIFSAVFQDYVRYEISLRENASLACPDGADDKKTEEIFNKIGFDSEIWHGENGLDVNLGKIREGGRDLSGGQWQKLAIARALLSDTPVYILDEPTAALDPIAESRLYTLFSEISKKKMSIFITHRLGAATLADKIIVISEGKSAEFGSHEELLAAGGEYAKMFEAQRSWYV